jgi:hypothetical protein
MAHSQLRLILFVAISALIFSIPTLAQGDGSVDPLAFFDKEKRWYRGNSESWFNFFDIPESDVRKSLEHWERIRHDLENLGSTKSGSFGRGGATHGTIVLWSERSGFVWLEVDHCMGGPMRIVRGRAEVAPTGVILYPEIRLGSSGGHEGHGGHGRHSKNPDRIELISITWMRSTYLVSRDQIPAFSDYAAGLGEYNSSYPFEDESPFLSSREDGSDSEPITFQPPVFPAGYERYMKRPVRGSIISIGKAVRHVNNDSDTSDDLVTPFKVRVESADNLKVGLFLHAVQEEPGFGESFEVRSFKGNVATVHNVRSIPKKKCVISAAEDCKVWDHVKLRPGLVLSSNRY